MFAGDPVTGAFWSGENIDGEGTRGRLGSRRFIVSPPRFDLQPGGSKTLSLAILYAQGADRLDSITELRAASDRVQAAYDDGSLFETTATTPLLSTPAPIAPTSDVVRSDSALTFEWTAAPDAQRYRLEVSHSGSFADTTAYVVASSMPEIHLPDEIIGNEPVTYHWRVRAESDTRRSPWSGTRTFSYYRYVERPLTLADGSPAFVEIAGPGGQIRVRQVSEARTAAMRLAVISSLGRSTRRASSTSTGDTQDPTIASLTSLPMTSRFVLPRQVASASSEETARSSVCPSRSGTSGWSAPVGSTTRRMTFA